MRCYFHGSITQKNDVVSDLTIPLDIMRGAKQETSNVGTQWIVQPDWPWVNPDYELIIPTPINNIDSIMIDPSYRTMDLVPENNIWDGQ